MLGRVYAIYGVNTVGRKYIYKIAQFYGYTDVVLYLKQLTA